jgi:hypothetical protein
MDTVLNVVRQYLQKNMPTFANAEIHLDTQDGSHDQHFAKSPLLPDVGSHHVDDNEYHVATVTTSVTVDGGAVIPKILKLTVKGDTVQRVIESK